jgi:hypothetical protein
MKNQTDRDKAFAKLVAHPIRITPANEARLAAVIRREECGATLWTITPHDLARMVEAGEAELDRLKLPKALRAGAVIRRDPPERYWGRSYGGGTFCKIIRGSRHWGLAWICYAWQEPAADRHPRTETVTVVLSLCPTICKDWKQSGPTTNGKTACWGFAYRIYATTFARPTCSTRHYALN